MVVVYFPQPFSFLKGEILLDLADHFLQLGQLGIVWSASSWRFGKQLLLFFAKRMGLLHQPHIYQ